MSKKKQLTREETENRIQEKLSEIRELCLAYNPHCYHISMYIIGVSQNVYCSDEKTGEILLQNHNGLFDEKEGADDV